MVFNSLTFLLFFGLVLVFSRLRISWTRKKIGLVCFSYLFYAAWNPPFVILLWISTLIDWIAGNRIWASRGSFQRRFYLILSLAVNLGLLGFFKYGNFLLDNFIAGLGWFNIAYQPLRPDIVLPVGISFYTFQSMSYTIDIYRGRMKPWGSFIDFALYVTFFPQLVAGPIVRSENFLPQCITPKTGSARQILWGGGLLVTGLFEKVFLADTLLAPVSDAVFTKTGQAGCVDAWIGTLAFSAQIFFDFAGYSTCAIGAALCLGFVLPDNFRFPYGALGFSDFWQRWHISLSSWLRDYLYIPLGGNRKGDFRTYGNLMLTMLIGGLWHGASWRFVAWGGLHGAFLVMERFMKRKWGPVLSGNPVWMPFILALATYFLIVVTWVFFRAKNFSEAFVVLYQMFHFNASGILDQGGIATVAAVSVCLFGFHFFMRNRSYEDLVSGTPVGIRAFGLALMLIILSLTPGDDRAFIYLQF
jgi:alginate O-acetyltransferase complex protein AlgI